MSLWVHALLKCRAEYDPKTDLLDQEFVLKGKFYRRRKDVEVNFCDRLEADYPSNLNWHNRRVLAILRPLHRTLYIYILAIRREHRHMSRKCIEDKMGETYRKTIKWLGLSWGIKMVFIMPGLSGCQGRRDQLSRKCGIRGLGPLLRKDILII